MKYRNGYLVSDDDVMLLSLNVIEDLAYRVFKDAYLTEEAKMDILDVYLDCRWRKKQDEFVYNEESLKRISEMNDLLIRLTKEAVKTAYEIFRHEMEVNNRSEKKYETIEVIPRLLVPADMYLQYEEPYKGMFTERDERMWKVLNSSYNKKYKWYAILPGTAGFNSYHEDDLEKCIEEDVVWGESLKDRTPEQRSWGCVMNVDREQTSDICFCWSFHNLLDFTNFTMDDILKINEFKMEIEINFN